MGHLVGGGEGGEGGLDSAAEGQLSSLRRSWHCPRLQGLPAGPALPCGSQPGPRGCSHAAGTRAPASLRTGLGGVRLGTQAVVLSLPKLMLKFGC